MLESHTEVEPRSQYIGRETVSQVRLDDYLSKEDIGGGAFLKVDVQGYERAVLNGATDLFKLGLFRGMQLELSLVPLYEGAMSFRDGLDAAEDLGMTLMGLDPVFSDPKSGQLLQVDAVFFF